MTDLGKRVFGLAAIGLGVIGLYWTDFAAVWQPVPKDLPSYKLLADAAAALFLVAGAAVQTRRGTRPAAIVLAALFTVFALLWLKRVIGFPSIFGTWSGMAEQLALVAGAVAIYATGASGKDERARSIAFAAQMLFGLCLVAFAFAHFLYLPQTEAMVPTYLPLGTRAWAIITGIGHLAAGLALLSGVRALLAARLLTAMFGVFALLVWAPQLLAHPHEHMAWCGNAINLALVGAAWAVADAIARFGARPAIDALRRPAHAGASGGDDHG